MATPEFTADWQSSWLFRELNSNDNTRVPQPDAWFTSPQYFEEFHNNHGR